MPCQEQAQIAGAAARLSVELPSRFLYHPEFFIPIRRKTVDNLRVLITRDRIAAKVAEMGQRISHDFAGEPVVLIGVLKGATPVPQVRVHLLDDNLGRAKLGLGRNQIWTFQVPTSVVPG